VKKLTALSNEPTYLHRYVAIRDKKHHTTRAPLTAAHPLIEERYECYLQAIGTCSLANIDSDFNALQLSSSLRSCYDVSTKPLKELKQAILDAQPKRLLKYCPMCGTTLPRTFDHYMPAIKFPEFAVHALNLIPCCSTCNSTKDDVWLTNAGRRQFLHAYMDSVPDLQFVQAKLHEDPALTGVGATFSLNRPEGMVDEIWELIESHFLRLKLIDRYNERGNDEVSEILSDCREFIKAGGSNADQFLSGRAEDRRHVYGRNHWIAVLMNAMAQHTRLMAWVDAA
jgi:hypothetical protein